MSYTVFYRSAPAATQVVLFTSGSAEYALDEMELNLSVSEAPELKFTMYRNHPYYDDVVIGNGTVEVHEGFADNTTRFIFRGYLEEIQTELDGTKKVYCVGVLGALNNTIQQQSMFQGTPNDYLTQLLNFHNRYAINFQPGGVDTTDNYILRYTNYESTFECIRRDLMEPFGVYPKLTGSGWQTLTLYTIENYGDLSTQVIRFGENLLDFAKDESKDELYTAVIPLGKKKDNSERDSRDIPALDAYVNIWSVNGGYVVLQDRTAVNAYGFRCAAVHWDDVTQPSNLLTKARAWLALSQFPNMRLSLTALDLSLLDVDISEFKVGDRVRCIVEHLGIDEVLPIYEMSIYPLNPEKNTITVGMDAPSLVGGTTTASNTRADAASAATLSEIMKVSTYTCTYMVGGGLQAALTANDFQASTPSGYTPIAIQRIAAGNANMLIRAYNAKATGTSAIINLYNNSSVNVTATATVDIVYVKTEVLGT